MRNLCWSIRKLALDEAGPTAVEYAALLGLIVAVCIAAIQTLGQRSGTTFQSVSSDLNSGGSAGTGLP
jgi:pilus assembly protein Flp/PilA